VAGDDGGGEVGRSRDGVGEGAGDAGEGRGGGVVEDGWHFERVPSLP